MKVPTLADARELNLLPSVTTILKIIHKPALQEWLIEQAVLAVKTSEQKKGETDDEFVHRILSVERVQDQEAKLAADRGTAIHKAISLAVRMEEFDEQWKPYVQSALKILKELGRIVWSEKHLAGNGYAGMSDILMENEFNLVLLDFKSAKTMPAKDSWPEAKLQTAAYANCLVKVADKQILTGNIYLSTVNVGEAKLFLQEDWQRTFEEGFAPLLKYWQFANNYVPGGAR